MPVAQNIKQTYMGIGFALIAAVGALLIGELVYLREVTTTDENSYLFQAWLFLQGDLKEQCPIIVKSFFHRMIVCDEALGWFSRYPPSHSIWIMPGVAIGYPHLMTVLAAFVAVYYLIRTGERLGVSVVVTACLILISPYFWLMQGSILSHTSGLAATAIMVWAYLVWLQDKKIFFAAVAGLAWAFLFLNRTYTAFLIAIPFAIDALVRFYYTRSWHNFKGTFVFACCSGTGAIFFLLYNYLMSGDPFMPTYLLYDPEDGLGFGQRHSIKNVSVIHTPQKGLEYIWNNLTTLNVRLYGFFGSLFVLLGLTIIGWKQKISPMFFSATLLVWIGYGAFWFEGIGWVAPVYWYETLVFITLLAGMGIQRLLNKYRSETRLPVSTISIFVLILVGAFSFNTFDAAAEEITDRVEFRRQYQKIIEDVPSNSILLLGRVHEDIKIERSFNPNGVQSDPLIVIDGLGVQHALYYLFPDRDLYRLDGHEGEPAKLVEDYDGSIPVIYAKKMRADIGEADDNDSFFVADESKDDIGRLGFNVHQYFIPGRYRITFHVETFGIEGQDIARVDVKAGYGSETLAEGFIKSGETQATLEIDVKKVKIAEPRVHFMGKGKLIFKKIEIDYQPFASG